MSVPTAAPTLPEPVRVSDAEFAAYSETRPFPYRLALFLARYSPRGRGWFPRRIGGGIGRGMTMVVRTENGARLAVEPSSLDYFIDIELRGGMIDAHVRDACLRVLRPGDVFYDIGANVGLLCNDIMAARRDAIRVVAFEPQPALAHNTALSARLNGFAGFDVYSVMLGAEAGTATLYVPPSRIHASAVARTQGTPSITCPIWRLDDLVASGRVPPPDVIKIDVEGGERDVFRGAERTLRDRAPFIAFEADINMRRFGYERADLLAELTRLADYEFRFIDGPNLLPAADPNDPRYSDLLAIPTAKRQRLD